MKKLLHERLREHADSGTLSFTGNGYDIALWSEEAQALADEIERYYIPREQHKRDIDEIIEAQKGGGIEPSAHHIMRLWGEHHDMPFDKGENITQWLNRWTIMRPRFEDGEPVQFDENVDVNGEIRETCVIEYQSDRSYSINPDDWDIDWHDIDEPVKRPQPKVLDADGIEIKIGDTVWSIDTHERFKIDAIYENGNLWSEGEDEHSGCYLEPKRVTHNEPDSLEKLRDDMDATLSMSGVIGMREFADRLSALIERGA